MTKLTLRCPEEMKSGGAASAFSTQHVVSGKASCTAHCLSTCSLSRDQAGLRPLHFFKFLCLGFALRRVLFLILCFFSSLSRSPTGTPCACSALFCAINQLPTSVPTKCRVLGVSRSLLGRLSFQVSVSQSMWYKNTGGCQVF